MAKSEYIHDETQHSSNLVFNDNGIKDSGISILSHQPPTIAHTIERINGLWFVDKHDGTGTHRIHKRHYEPKFVVTRIMTNQMTTEWQTHTEGQEQISEQIPVGGIFDVMVDMPNCKGLEVSLATAKPLMLHVTKIYLTLAQDCTNIILLG